MLPPVHFLVMAGQNMTSTYQFQVAQKAAQEITSLFLASIVVHSDLKSALSDTMSLHFYFSPLKRFWWSPSGLEQWCYDEAYTSDAWLKYHNELQLQPNEPGCKLEKVVLGLMFWSNSTHLTSLEQWRFGPCTCTLATFQNIFITNSAWVLVTM